MSDKKTKTKDAEALAGFLSTAFTRSERTVAIDKIVKECIVPRATVYNWMYGCCRIPELYKRKIEEIFGEKIFFAVENL